VICPWQIYLTHGDESVLNNQFNSMRQWVDYITENTKEKYLWLGGIFRGLVRIRFRERKL